MTDNVVAMRAGAPMVGRANPDIVETLERLLAKAKSGDLRAFAYAAFSDPSDGQDKGMSEVVATGWDGGGGTKFQLGSAIALLSHRYNRRLLGEPE